MTSAILPTILIPLGVCIGFTVLVLLLFYLAVIKRRWTWCFGCAGTGDDDADRLTDGEGGAGGGRRSRPATGEAVWRVPVFNRHAAPNRGGAAAATAAATAAGRETDDRFPGFVRLDFASVSYAAGGGSRSAAVTIEGFGADAGRAAWRDPPPEYGEVVEDPPPSYLSLLTVTIDSSRAAADDENSATDGSVPRHGNDFR